MTERDEIKKKLIRVFMRMVDHYDCLTNESDEELLTTNNETDAFLCEHLPVARKWAEKQLKKHFA